MKPERKHIDSFRDSLVKLLPGYKWTVHKPMGENLIATGIQSAGSNRLSTVEVKMRADGKWFEARISGYGTRASWLKLGLGVTLAQAIRSLQSGLEHQAQVYASQAQALNSARAEK